MKEVIIGLLILIIIAGIIYFIHSKRQEAKPDKKAEVRQDSIETLAAYVKAQKDEAEAKQRLKDLDRAEKKYKLEVFKQTKDQLKDRLKTQIDGKEWKSLDSVLRSADKGVSGIYILYNRTKNKYYVGQAKELLKRVRDHFKVEDIALDYYMSGDTIEIKFLTAAELGTDYRIDHIEKTGMEIFNSENDGYNKKAGNL